MLCCASLGSAPGCVVVVVHTTAVWTPPPPCQPPPDRRSRRAGINRHALICGSVCQGGRVKRRPPTVVGGRRFWSVPALSVTGVSVSTRGHSDMRGLVTAGRAVRLERCRGSRDRAWSSASNLLLLLRIAHRACRGLLRTLPSPQGSPEGRLWGAGRLSVVEDGQGPAPAGQFAGDRGVGDHRGFLAVDEPLPACVQPSVARMAACRRRCWCVFPAPA
jgi:hypothetical protein